MFSQPYNVIHAKLYSPIFHCICSRTKPSHVLEINYSRKLCLLAQASKQCHSASAINGTNDRVEIKQDVTSDAWCTSIAPPPLTRLLHCGERRTCKPKIAGSNPAPRGIFFEVSNELWRVLCKFPIHQAKPFLV